jgi:hypothetical protein
LERDEIVVRESFRRAIVGMDGPWGLGRREEI